MITKKKAGRLKKFRRTIHPKNGIISPLRAYWKNPVKLVPWIEYIAKGSLGLFLQRKSWIWYGLLTGTAVPCTFSAKKNHRKNRTQSVINTENGKRINYANTTNEWKNSKLKRNLSWLPWEKNLKVISVLSKKQFGKMKNISFLKFMSIAERSCI